MNLERIEAIINKSPTLTITDMNLLEGVITVIMEAVTAEREACARLCEEHKALRLSEIIRARGEK
jgi:regulator of protease activity HflC (stomatin/prohibitin superfamily)